MSQQASKHIAQNGAWTVNAHAVSIVRPTPSMDSDPTRTQGRHTSTWRPRERGFACVKRSTWVRFSFIPSVRLLHWVFTSKGSFVPMAVPLPAAPGSCCARGVMWVVARFVLHAYKLLHASLFTRQGHSIYRDSWACGFQDTMLHQLHLHGHRRRGLDHATLRTHTSGTSTKLLVTPTRAASPPWPPSAAPSRLFMLLLMMIVLVVVGVASRRPNSATMRRQR